MPQTANNSAPSAQPNATNSSAQRAMPQSANSSESSAQPNAANTSALRAVPQNEHNSATAQFNAASSATNNSAQRPATQSTNNAAPSAQPNATNNSTQRAMPQSANTSAPSAQPNATNNSTQRAMPQSTNTAAPSAQPNAANNSASSAQTHVLPPRVAAPQPEVTLVNRVLPGDVKLFEPEGSPGGCASGECLVPPPLVLEEQEPEPEAPPTPTHIVGDDEKWRRAVDALRNASPRHGKSLSYARFLGFTPEGVKLAFPTDAAFHRAQIVGLSRAMIEAELARSLGRPVKVLEDTTAAALQSAPKSIAELEATDRNTRERSIEEKVRMHPALRNVLKHLGGNLEHISYLEPTPKKPIAADEGDGSPPVD